MKGAKDLKKKDKRQYGNKSENTGKPRRGSFPETLLVYLLAVVFGASREGKQIRSVGEGGGIHTTSKCWLVLSEGAGGPPGPRRPPGALTAPP